MSFKCFFPGLWPRAARRALWRGRRELAQCAKTSAIDRLAALNAARAATSTNGQGVHVSYFGAAGSSTTPVYTPPVNAYETITTVSALSGVPTSLLERDTDGTTRRFDVFESTSVLRLSLLTDKNGNTVTYNRDGLGRLTHVEDVHGRYFNLTYNPAGLVATLADSGGRSSSYAYDASGRRTGDTGPLGTTAYLYDASNRMVKITYPNGSVKNYAYDASNRVLSEDDGAGGKNKAPTHEGGLIFSPAQQPIRFRASVNENDSSHGKPSLRVKAALAPPRPVALPAAPRY